VGWVGTENTQPTRHIGLNVCLANVPEYCHSHGVPTNISKGGGDGGGGVSLDRGPSVGPVLDSRCQLSTPQKIRSSGCGGCGSYIS
jgi:hypothetical protein